MAKLNASEKIDDLGDKIDFLSGILGHERPQADFQGSKLARIMFADESQVSNKRVGRATVSYAELAALIDFFRLSPHFDFELFLQPLEDFKLALKEAKVGTYAGPSDSVARAELMKLAATSSKVESPRPKLTLRLRQIGQQRRAGGLGYADLTRKPTPNYKIGELVIIDVVLPGPGHLVILNDQLDIETTCLMPSMFAETTAVKSGTLCLPTSDDYRHFEIVAPSGNFRLYAIWTPTEQMLPWSEQRNYAGVPLTLAHGHLADYVRSLPKNYTAVAVLDYQVMR